MSGPIADVKVEASNGPQEKHQPGQMHMNRGGQGGGRGGHGGRPRFTGGGGGGGGRPRDDSRGGRVPDVLKSEKSIDVAEVEGDHSVGVDRGHSGDRGHGGPHQGFRGGRGGQMGGVNRFQGGPRQGMGGRDNDGRGMRTHDDRLNERIAALSGPTHDLPPQEVKEKKFSGRNRLYIGNLTNDVSDEEMTQLFTPFGEISELFVNKEKNFAFVRMDYRASAEKAKRELDGSLRKNRPLKVRFAPHSAAIKVKNLTQWVTNELLELAFSVFGEIERAVIIVDERGKSMGEGIVEFNRKPGALMALRRCSEGCFFLTSSLRPVVVELYDQVDDIDGYPEKNLPKKTQEYYKARDAGPRFATPGSFEHEYGTRWKQLHELYKQKEEALQREIKMEEEKLEAQMEYAKYEHETEMLRDQLRQREQDRDRQKREWELKERQAEEQRRTDEDLMRRQQDEMTLRMHHQEEELRRRQQENTLFMQAHQLSSMLDQQEQAMHTTTTTYDSPTNDIRDYGEGVTGMANIPPDPKSFLEAYDRGGSGRYEGGGRGDLRDENGGLRSMGGNPRGRWGSQTDRRPVADDFPSKRRRY